MLLLSSAMLMVFAILSSIIVGYLSNQYEKTQYLKNYDLAMATLAESFHGRLNSFNTLAGKLLSGNQCDPNLCELLKSPSYDEVPAGVRRNVISLLSSISRDDQYLRGFFIYSPEHSMLYYYSDSKSYLSYADSLPGVMPSLSPYSGSKVDLSSVNDMIFACTDRNESNSSLYGIAATIYRNPSEPLGYLIPLYSTSEFENILSNYQLDSSSTFLISDRSENIYFHSYPFSQEDNDDARFSNSLWNHQLGFQVSYEINKSNLPRSSTTYLLVIFAVIVTLFSFLLYYLTYYFSSRNMNGILKGMEYFSVDNLTYRIPVPKGRHEFAQIIQGFNAMCEKLQLNVEHSYVYELQQKKSELYALQNSINPHFLYNTLEIIRNQVLTNPSTASQMILLLSKIYRSQTNTNMFVAIEDEVELCENLMILYQYRFQNFDYEFRIEDDIQHFALPKNTLQPLIENYFVHGIVPERQDNILLLEVYSYIKEGTTYVRLCLSNNGNPITMDRLKDITKGVNQDIYSTKNSDDFALSNIHSRLRIVFRDDCSMTVCSGTDTMNFQIDLTFPALTVDQLQGSFGETSVDPR